MNCSDTKSNPKDMVISKVVFLMSEQQFLKTLLKPSISLDHLIQNIHLSIYNYSIIHHNIYYCLVYMICIH